MDITYSLETKKRIQEVQFEDFINFLLIIPREKLDTAIKSIPKVKGFRSGKDTEIRLKVFFGRSTSWDEKEWSMMLNLWVMHTVNNIPIKNSIGFKDKKELEEIVINAISSRKDRRGITEKLIQASHTENLSQKMILNWLLFSPFPKDTAVEKLVNMMPKENTFELKEKITTIENILKTFKNDYVEQIQFNSTNKHLAKINTDLASLTNNQKSLQIDLKKVSESISQCERDIKKFLELSENKNKEVNVLRKSFSRGIENLGQFNKEVKDIQKVLNEAVLHDSQSDAYINELMVDLELHKNKLEEVETKLESVIKEGENKRITNNTSSSQNFDGPDTRPKSDFFLKNYTLKNEEVPVILSSKEAVIGHLEKNFNSLGIKLPHAKRLAREVIAGLASGQLISFKGQLAELVARRCASSLTGGKYKYIKVPFGCLDSSSLDDIISGLVEESNISSDPIAIVLEGVNRSAFELYGNSIKQIVIERSYQIGIDTRSLFIFATIIEGSSIIPVGTEYAELGPLINVNSLKWLDKATNKGRMGIVEKITFLELFSLPPYDHDWDDSILPEWLNILGGPLWRRVLLNADTHGRGFDSSFEEFLEFTIFSWLMPMLIAIDSSKISDFMEYAENDDRLKYYFIKYAPEAMMLNASEIY
jgi:hypothetical protein